MARLESRVWEEIALFTLQGSRVLLETTLLPLIMRTLPISKEDSKQREGQADTSAGTFAYMYSLIPTTPARGCQHCSDLLSDRKTKG